jgi:hypothetical protein
MGKVNRRWTPSYGNNKVEWVNFHLKHKDHVKVKVKTTNAALNSITSETDGFVVDLITS